MMDIQALERELLCLRCEAEGQKLRPCEHEFEDAECRAQIMGAYYRLMQVWEPVTDK